MFGIRPLRLRDVFVPSQAWAIEQQCNMVEDVPADATLLVDDQVLALEEALQQ